MKTAARATAFILIELLVVVAIIGTANGDLTWRTNYPGFDYAGYTLQSTANPASPVWTTNLPAVVVINGQNAVTNPMSREEQIFRLSQ